MLGNPGSNPLELFWDVVDNLDQELDAKIAVVEEAISRHNDRLHPNGDNDVGPGHFVIGPEVKEEWFLAVMNKDQDDAVKALSDADLHLVFNTVSEMRYRPRAESDLWTLFSSTGKP